VSDVESSLLSQSSWVVCGGEHSGGDGCDDAGAGFPPRGQAPSHRARSLTPILALTCPAPIPSQNHLLDDIERGVDQTNGDMRGAQSRMIRLLKRTSDCKWILAIIVLAMIALGLLGWVFRAH
jgi:hypothetical protein